ncbi:MAG TPA: sulfotransferase domain-containing protein [Acidimicrobiia bacterium]|nr:sulfotransferase domain-containing protein [Acidimicrobiia bacterium]
MRQYREDDADNARWHGFRFRPGDVVISAPSKSGTTWTQLLVALLIFDGPEFPESIGNMSLWMDQKTRPVEEAHGVFAAQPHRRFIKTHTPMDGLPIHDDVRYVCVGRDPRDAAISMIHHSDNLDRKRLGELIGVEFPPRERPSDEEALDRWLEGEDVPGWNARFVLHHYRTFWDVKDEENVALFHFEDYRNDLPAEITRLAGHLGIEVPDGRAAELAAEAAIDRVRSRADDIAPEAHMGVFKDTGRFFRSGGSGEWERQMTPAQQERYQVLADRLAAADLARWIHHGRR